MNRTRLVLRSLGAVALAAIVGTSLGIPGANAAASAGGIKPGLDLANLDTSCKACDDFWGFATGGWRKAHPIPAAFASWGTFNVLAEGNRAVVQEIAQGDAAEKNAAKDSNAYRVGAFYRTCMDEAAIEKAGIAPITPELDRIAAVSTVAGMTGEIGRLTRMGADLGFNFTSTPDTLDSSKTIAGIRFGGLSLPDRDYYVTDDPKSVSIRDAFLAYAQQQFENLGEPAAQAKADAATVMAHETAIAKATPRRVDLRDPHKTYHPMSLAQLQQQAPQIDWASYVAGWNPPPFTTVDVTYPETTGAIAALLASEPLATWKTEARFRLVNAYANALPKRFADASFGFYSTTLQGTKEQQPRDKRCTQATDAALGQALGQQYVAKTFPPEARSRALAMVNNLQSTLREDIGTLTWMSPATKAYAVEKLDAYTKKIGYPDTWRDYAKLAIADDSYAANLMRVRDWNTAYQIAKIGKPTDRNEFGMTPPTVNAYYNPSNNEIVFPAGILQPPFFSEAADDAINYGAVGAVIGHEMTHGFDDQGRQFDAKGNLRDWWTPADATAFKGKAQCIVDEFTGFEVAPGVHEQGALVQGEAIADLGGLTIAYKAFEKTAQFKAGKKIDGYTPAQRFFLAYAQVWAGSRTEALQRQAAATDPHPAPEWRVVGTLANMPEFARAFNCPETAKMVRRNRCQIW